MPVEIKELVIRAVVQAGATTAAGAPATASSAPEDREALIEATVKEVLRILRESRER